MFWRRKKFTLSDETIDFNGHTLHRIKAKKSFGDVKYGDKGGWLEKEDNLSHHGNCWVFGNGKVYGDAFVYEDAKVHGSACVYDSASLSEYSVVRGLSTVCGSAAVDGHAVISDCSCLSGNCTVTGNVLIHGDAIIGGNAVIRGNAEVCGNVKIGSRADIGGDSKIFGDTVIDREAYINGNAVVGCSDDYDTISVPDKPAITWTRSNNMWCDELCCGNTEDFVKSLSPSIRDEIMDAINKFYSERGLETAKESDSIIIEVNGVRHRMVNDEEHALLECERMCSLHYLCGKTIGDLPCCMFRFAKNVHFEKED